MEPVFARKLVYYYQQSDGLHLHSYDPLQEQNTFSHPLQRTLQYIQQWQAGKVYQCSIISVISGCLLRGAKSVLSLLHGCFRWFVQLQPRTFFFVFFPLYKYVRLWGCGLRVGGHGEWRVTESGSTITGAQEEWPLKQTMLRQWEYHFDYK